MAGAADDYARSIGEITRAQDAARASTEALLGGIGEETRYIGLNASERRTLQAVLSAEAEMRRRLNDEVAQGVGRSAEAQAALVAEAGERARNTVQMLEAGEAAEAAAQQYERSWMSAVDGVSDAIGGWLSGSIRSFGDFKDALKGQFRRLLAEMISMTAKPIVLRFATSIFGGGGQGGGIGSALGSLFGGGQGGGQGGGFLSSIMGGIGSLFGGGGNRGGGGILGSIFGSMGPSVGSIFSGSGVLGSLGRVLGLGGGGASGGILGGLGSLFGGGGGAGGLGALGALGPVGAALGAVYAFRRQIFGTRSRPTGNTSDVFDFANGNVSVSGVAEYSRRSSIFSGGRTRYWERSRDVDQSIVDGARDGLAASQERLRASAEALGREFISSITASFRRNMDAQGNVTSEGGTVLGVRYDETLERFQQRVEAAELIALIDSTLSGVSNAAQSGAAEMIETAAGGISDALSAGGFDEALKNLGSTVSGEASAIAQRWRGDAATLLDGARFLLTASVDLRNGVNLLGEGTTLTAITDITEELNRDGESLAQTYARIGAQAQQYRSVLESMQLSFQGNAEQLVRIADGMATVAGGADALNGLLSGFFENFYSDAERNEARLRAARSSFNSAADAAGIDRSSTQAEIRAIVEEALASATLSAEQRVLVLQAAQAFSELSAATQAAGSAAAASAASLAEFMSSIRSELVVPEVGIAEQLAQQRSSNDSLIAQAIALGASESELAAVRAVAQQRIDAISASTADQSATLVNALRFIGTAIDGTAEDIAAASGRLSSDFGSLFDEFSTSFYSDAERNVVRRTQAEAQLAEAMNAAGIAAGTVIERTQLRSQIEAALASGSFETAEALLRVARALNLVSDASGDATTQATAAAAAAVQASAGTQWSSDPAAANAAGYSARSAEEE
ncbi:MAG: hypothetical protein ACRC1H_12070, partial [Caldilineaceae bacterium]